MPHVCVPSISTLACFLVAVSRAGLAIINLGNTARTRKPTEGDHIEDLERLVYSSRCETSAVSADADAADFTYVCLKLLDRFNADRNLLPELDHAVNGAGDEEIGEWCHRHERKLILVHQGFGVTR